MVSVREVGASGEAVDNSDWVVPLAAVGPLEEDVVRLLVSVAGVNHDRQVELVGEGELGFEGFVLGPMR